MKNWLVVLLMGFTVTVKIPLMNEKKYYNVERITPYNFYYELRLSTGKTVYIPMLFSVIEEN